MTAPTDREMVIDLGKWRGWTPKLLNGEFHGTFQYRDERNRICTRFSWNPIDNPFHAWELEGMVPEEKRQLYVDELRREALGRHSLTITFQDAYHLRRATPRQIATAMWRTCCK